MGLRQHGVTLIELMVTMTIMTVLLLVVPPAFDQVRLRSRLVSYANDLVLAANLARSEAIKRNANVDLCISSDGTNCATTGDWTQGWIVKSGSTVVMRRDPLDSAYLFANAGATRTLTFKSTGVGSTAVTLKLCRANPVGNEERLVTVTSTGRASVSKSTTGSCS